MPDQYKDLAKLKRYFKIPNPDLLRYLDHVKHGNAVVYRTPYWESSNDPQSIVDAWMKRLLPLRDEWPGMYEFEKDLRKKVGPMSYMKPLSSRMDDIDSYYQYLSPDAENIDSRALDSALDGRFAIRGMRIRSQRRTWEGMKKSTSSGSPFYKKKRDVGNLTIPCSFTSDGTDVTQILPSGSWLTTALLGWRGQEGGPTVEDVKQRVVWMFPCATNIAELQYYQPAIERVQAMGSVPAWVSFRLVDEHITQLFDTKDDNDYVICTDFTAFDQHFGLRCQEAAKYMISRTLYDDADSEQWLDTVFDQKYMMPLCYGRQAIRHGRHGMGSGSGGTNFDETMVHSALQYEAALRANTQLNPYSMCLGDDGLLTFPGIDVDHIVDCYSSHGLEMNPSKQTVATDECVYLRHYHHRDYRQDGVCVGVYSTCRALGKLLFRERNLTAKQGWGPIPETIRSLSILENCKFHPLREEFVKFVLKGDKLRLGLNIPGFFDNLAKHVKDTESNGIEVLNYVKSNMESNPIDAWWIVRYLKSLG